jgi:hypothetical protein
MTNERDKSGGKPAAKAARERRLAEALRANLKRRKAAAPPEPPSAKPPPKPGSGHLE